MIILTYAKAKSSSSHPSADLALYFDDLYAMLMHLFCIIISCWLRRIDRQCLMCSAGTTSSAVIRHLQVKMRCVRQC